MTLLRHDFLRSPVAVASATTLIAAALFAILGPALFGDVAGKVNLRARNAPPFDLHSGWLNILGADALGRSIVARIAVAARNTIGIAAAAVVASLVVGGGIGVLVGLSNGRMAGFIMRCVDIVMSFPSLLLALVVLYVLSPSPWNVVLVLAITRMPIYVRTARAEVLEIRERAFIAAARVMGGGTRHIAMHHVVPLVLPTLLIVAGLEFALVVLAESALSFLGMGIQPPDMTWGLMVSDGRSYIATAWWVSFWPGLTIVLVALSANLLANWFRGASDPTLRKPRKVGADA
ncbi:MAG: ABC transporter permease [Rhodobacteraceae bacterium]|jgi:peptide/nickel transport system permease protein|nr:ABC transporter permease [Paracoccaceae bacterium]